MTMQDDDEDPALASCSFCGDKVALNRAIRLMIAPCGHTICQPCFGSGFKGTRTMACKACGKDENGNTFDFAKEEVIPTDGEDEMVKRELRIRSRVLGIFNRQEADFIVEGKSRIECAREYNAYLEDVEDMVSKLLRRIDVERTEARIADQEAQHKDVIYRNQALKKIRDGQIGVKPFSWQIPPPQLKWAPEPSSASAAAAAQQDKLKNRDKAHIKHEERESSRQQAAAEARKLHQKMLAQKGKSVEQGPLPEDFAVEIKAGEGDAVVGPKDAKRAKTAGGSKVEHVQERERLSALLGIVASLRRRTTTES